VIDRWTPFDPPVSASPLDVAGKWLELAVLVVVM
jgi:hypothetical protein